MQVPEPCLELVGQIVENTSIITQGCVTEESAAAAELWTVLQLQQIDPANFVKGSVSDRLYRRH